MSQDEKEMWERVVKALAKLADAVVRMAKTIADAVAKALKPYIDAVAKLYWEKISNAPPRIKYLALHAKKHRTRKKNWARLMAYG